MMNLTTLKSLEIHPRVHGNGFIQLDLDKKTRLHFWGHPDIPKQKTSTPVHSHIFNFTSTILKGTLTNIVHIITQYPNNEKTYHMYEVTPRQRADTSLQKMSEFLYKTNTKSWIYSANESYAMPRFTYHETYITEPTITLMKKTYVSAQGIPHVLVPSHLTPDTTFDRYGFPEEMLWDIIQKIIGE
jgi:hypothetical protein